MKKQILAFVLVLAVVMAFSLPALAQEVVTGKIQVFDKVAKKININETEYILTDEAARSNFKIGDQVEATIKGKVVKKLVRVLQ